MRSVLLFVLGMTFVVDVALAQNTPSPGPSNNPAANSAVTDPTKPAPAQPQPQGPTGPTTTTSGGAPASSPQGDTSSRMQPIPDDPKKGVEPK